MNKLSTSEIIKNIRKNQKIKNKIKHQIITLREYADPRLTQSHNIILRSIKKTILFFFSPFLKSQIIFNKNSVRLFEDLYKYINHLENKIKYLEKRQK